MVKWDMHGLDGLLRNLTSVVAMPLATSGATKVVHKIALNTDANVLMRVFFGKMLRRRANRDQMMQLWKKTASKIQRFAQP